MNMATATAKLTILSAPKSSPVLDDAVINQILEDSLIDDEDGLFPDDVGYVPTYDFDEAAAKVFEAKLAIVAGEFDFSDGSRSVQRMQRIENLKDMVSRFRSKTVSSGRMTPAQVWNGVPLTPFGNG